MVHGTQTVDERSIRVEGRFDAFVAQGVRSLVEEKIALRPETLVVDLSNVSFVDSAALAVLVWGHKQMIATDGELIIIRPLSQDAFRVFELTRFDRVFTIRNPE